MNADLVAQVAVLQSPRELAFQQETLHQAGLESDEFIARTEISVVSPGTEVAAFVGLPPLRPGNPYPRLVGYCNVATLTAAGPDSEVAIGDRVLTFQSHRSAFKASADEVILTVPEGVGSRDAAATYLFHLGYNALLRGGFRPGQTVLVLGLGTLGIATVAVAAGAGAHVLAMSDQPDAREVALRAGAAAVFDKDSVDAARRHGETNGSGAGIDLAITTANGWNDWTTALRLPRKDGTIAVLGFPGRGEPPATDNPLASHYFYDRQLRIVSCGYTPDLTVPPEDIRYTIKRNCRHLLDLIQRGVLDPTLLVTHDAPWTDLASVYERMARREPGLRSCAMHWKGGSA